jgi:hypothetical protein
MLTVASKKRQNRKVTGIEREILICGALNSAALLEYATSAFKATEIFLLDQNAISNHFSSICDAATEPDSSESSVSNLPEHSSSTNSAALRHC